MGTDRAVIKSRGPGIPLGYYECEYTRDIAPLTA